MIVCDNDATNSINDENSDNRATIDGANANDIYLFV